MTAAAATRGPESRATPPAERGYWGEAARALLHDWTAVAGMLIVALLALSAALAPLIAPYDPTFQHSTGLTLDGRPRTPGADGFLLGTDELGRDELSRLVYGARVSLVVGATGTLLAAVLGVAWGAAAGMARGLWQAVLMRMVDVILSFPTLLLAIALLAVTKPRMLTIILIVGATFGAGLSRIVFSQVTSLREREFVVAARASGVRSPMIVLRHIVPHLLPSVIVMSTLSVATIIMFEAGLSYVGIGIQPPQASWGNMISSGQSYLLSDPWLIAVPAGSLVVTMIGFALLGDGLRDVLDPTLERQRGLVRTGLR